jgi:formylglycine-generating enzyme required for sulfatase activity
MKRTPFITILVLLGLLLPSLSAAPPGLGQAPTSDDATPPAPVTSLSAHTGAWPGSVELSWIAPGDDGTTGTATAYVVRYNTEPITEDNWVSSSEVAGEPSPNTAGSPESMTVSGLMAGRRYHFALKTEDEVPNVSWISNSPWAKAHSLPNVVHLPATMSGAEVAPPVIPDTTVVLPDTTTRYLESISDDMTFTFREMTPELQALQPGHIIAGEVSPSAPNGFLRKVESVELLCDKVVVNTEWATLEDAVQSGSFHVSQRVTPEQVITAQLADGVMMATSPDGLGFDLFLTEVVVYDHDGDLRTKGDQITASGKLSLELTFDAELELRWFEVEKFRFIVIATEKTELSVNWKVARQFGPKNIKIAELTGNWIKTVIGPLPVGIKPKYTLNLRVEGEVGGAISTGVTQQATLRLGVAYENSQWSGISEFNNNFQFNPPQMELSGSVKAGLGPRAEFLFYGVAGPVIGANVYLQLEGKLSEWLELDLYGGLELYAGAKVQFLGKTLEEYDSPIADHRIPLHHWDIWANRPPNAPSNPVPGDDAVGQPRNPILSWTGSDPDGDAVTYDVYLEANEPYPDVLVSDDQANTWYDAGMLDPDTYYYWRVVAKDAEGATNSATVWSFRTGTWTNQLPYEPSGPSPVDGATDQQIYLNLAWIGGDPDGDTVTYDVYLEAGMEPLTPTMLLCDDASIPLCYAGALLTGTVYYWQVVPQDEHGRTNPGPVWKFTTGTSANRPPTAPYFGYPSDGRTNQSLKTTLQWLCNDPDEDPITYDVYFEAEDGTPDRLLCGGTQDRECDASLLQGNTRYYWQVVAHDDEGATTAGPVWSFTTVDMVYIPAGEFQMGCDACNPNEQCLLDETPVHTVTLSAYAIDRTEVTNAEYAACVAATYCQPPLHRSSSTHPIYYYGISGWSPMTSGTAQDLYGVWGSLAVGGGGTILDYDGTSWSPMSSGTAEDLYGVGGSFAVGGSGTILHYNGTAWSAMTSGTTYDLYGVWGSSGNVFAVGTRGTILHYDGTSWSPMASNTTNELSGVWGSGPSDVFAVGNLGTVLHYDGMTWSPMTSDTGEQLRAVWGSTSVEAFAVGDSGAILHGTWEFADYPVLWVDWGNAAAYCDWAGWTLDSDSWRLPTEAEWEKAARGSSDTRNYPWGWREPDCSLLNYEHWNEGAGAYEYCVGDTGPVGGYPGGVSPYGLLEMSGNVSEWVADWYGSGYYDRSPYEDPTGPVTGTHRVVRGGAWLSDSGDVRTARRFYVDPSSSNDSLGFRCVDDSP